MRELLTIDLASGQRATISHSTRADGDLSPSTVPAHDLLRRRERAVDIGPWHVVHQVHGRGVLEVRDRGSSEPLVQADALATTQAGQVLAVHSGDCVPVGLIHTGGAVGVAHAGWKGLQAGVLEAAAGRLRSLAGDGDGTSDLVAAIGPHVHVDSYAFSTDDLARLTPRFGDEIVGLTTAGEPALDLTAATTGELARLDIDVRVVSPDCTATIADSYWSHRARGETGRIALVAWIEST